MRRDEPTTFSLVGAGAAASALGPALRGAGLRPTGVCGLDRRQVEDLAAILRTSAVSLEEAATEAGLVCLLVPDDSIGEVCEHLTIAREDWSGVRVLHCSGALGADVLDPLRERGAVTFAFHPVQTFAMPARPDALIGVHVGIDGDEQGIECARSLARRLGLGAVVVPGPTRTMYHLAAAIASNGVTTLASMAYELLAGCGIERKDAAALIRPMIMTAARNLVDYEPEDALTGPVVRGDVHTVERHLSALAAKEARLVPAWSGIVIETVRLAVRSGRLDPATAESMLTTVAETLAALDESVSWPEP